MTAAWPVSIIGVVGAFGTETGYARTVSGEIMRTLVRGIFGI